MKLTLFDISIRTISINLKLLKLYLFTLRIIIKNQVMRRLLKRLLDCLNWKIKLKNSNLEQLLSLVRFLYFLKKVFSVNYLNNYIHSHSVDFYIEIDSTDTNYFIMERNSVIFLQTGITTTIVINRDESLADNTIIQGWNEKNIDGWWWKTSK